MNLQASQVIKKRCNDFTLKRLKEVRGRLPANLDLLQKMSLFSIDNCLKPLKESITELAEYMGTSVADIDKIINQWNNLHRLQWIYSNNTCEFWNEAKIIEMPLGIMYLKN
ncbi:hypothetical protein Zmor_028001 [Zophobas morio]|uniref:Uncharacterized protein n=1 Tax=Zophobas morio TaxID=2755281 RepID=A0AA38HQ50_9CUCU|nr:hypothetical protein Zmor_028001 [Zophobas morio]